MLYQNITVTDRDKDIINRLSGFLPDRIFDTHAHIYDSNFLPNVHPAAYGRSVGDLNSCTKSLMPILCNPKELRLNMIIFPDAAMANPATGYLAQSDAFLIDQLCLSDQNVGEIIVLPGESPEDIEKRLVHPHIRGFKCYHVMADAEVTWNLPIGAYLPESAWEVANKHKLCITLHMVKDEALADPENLNYICTMAKKYPDAVLILAHAARSFAAWTAVETVDKIAHLENIWYDFSGICESPAAFTIMQKVGTDRCMWGSDYPVSNYRGKAISLADGFYWLYDFECESKPDLTEKMVPVGVENLLAVRQACLMANLTESQIEDVFYNNAARLFK